MPAETIREDIQLQHAISTKDLNDYPHPMISDEGRGNSMPNYQFMGSMNYNPSIVDSYQIPNIRIIDDLFSWVWGIVYKVMIFPFNID